MEHIRIGTLVHGHEAPKVISQIKGHGFESFGLLYSEMPLDTDLKGMAKQVKEAIADSGQVISCLSLYGNPLTHGNDNEDITRWEKLIDHAHYYGTNLVTGFTGRIPDCSIDQSMPRFKEVFGELTRRAEDRGVKIAFENCDMDGDWYSGDWNLAHHPAAWEMMFNAVPSDNIGLEWEPAHQLWKLIEPIPQLRKWMPKIFHLHGKDASIAWDVVKEYGIAGPKRYGRTRTPGFGDTNWKDIISILMDAGYKGTIDIEGWHDPFYKDELEMTGQVYSLQYLKSCRGIDYVPNP